MGIREAALLSLIAESLEFRRKAGTDVVWHHCPDSRRCDGRPGLPDLIIVGSQGVIFRELKSEKGETTAEQDYWGWLLGLAGPLGRPRLHDIWRSADWDSGLIGREIDQICPAFRSGASRPI
jgi:hypothetical protein